MARVYNKLVRDGIPGIIAAEGGIPVTEALAGEALLQALEDKLREEVAEFLESRETEEICDIVEVLYAILGERGISRGEMEAMRKEKATLRGGFSGGIFLREVR